MAFKYENYDGGSVTAWHTPAYNGNFDLDQVYQTFTPQISHTVELAKVYIRKIADSPTVNFMAAAIVPTDENGRPIRGGGGISKLTNFGSTEQTAYDWKWVEFIFSSTMELTAGTMYALVFYYQPNSGTFPIQWARATPDTNYPRGQIWHYAWDHDGDPYVPYPGDWYDGTGEGDMYFEEWGEGDEPPSDPPDDIQTFPPPRPDDYDPDVIWTPPTSPIPGNPNTWQDPGLPYQTTGGGRWGRNLVVAGHGLIYYEDYT